MRKLELVVKFITVICFVGAFVYGIGIGNFVTVAKCAFGAFICFLPDAIYALSKKRISYTISILFYMFLLGSVFVTELFDFYNTVPHWDTFLHGFSGAVLAAFGFGVVDLLNKEECIYSLNPFFVGVFAFSFALAVGALWEIYEYSFDCILGMNMQRFLSLDGEVLSGQEALYDTMKDIIVDCIFALVTSFTGGTILKVKNKREEIMAELKEKY